MEGDALNLAFVLTDNVTVLIKLSQPITYFMVSLYTPAAETITPDGSVNVCPWQIAVLVLRLVNDFTCRFVVDMRLSHPVR